MHKVDLDLHVSPTDLYSILNEHFCASFLLESSEGDQKRARFSFLGFSPTKTVKLNRGVITVDGQELDTISPIKDLKSCIPRTSLEEKGFFGGAVGYFSFEYVNYIEKFTAQTQNDLRFPDFEFGIYEDVIIYDHLNNTLRYVYQKENRVNEILNSVKDSSFSTSPLEMYNKKCNLTKEQFCENVEIAQDHIRNGDIFQSVLSKRYEVKYSGNLISFYKKLRAINPSPYMFYLKFDERQIIGSSPENLVRLEGQEITSYATLAGTRKRGETVEEDKRLETELLNDPKERAEHLMLVDLTRNDIGKVAAIGSVSVPEFMKVSKYSHVQHISSIVKGKLKEGKNSGDVFEAIFPAGTVSGAPKIRAIEIIKELEKTNRGPYSGAVGYFSSNDNADFAIGIRTLFSNKNKAYIQSGAGIVYDSVPQKEYEETEQKAKPLLLAIGEEKYERSVN
ncbi:MAG: anthranilate synthase component I family protein [Candidatus Micrarchaeota archaeon]